VKRLLLVDDEQNVLVGMRHYFRAAGFAVDCASEREEAEALLSSVRYDAVLVDLNLTAGRGPDGLNVIPSARDNCRDARIVVLTACGSAEREAEARRLGADAFMQKPQPLDKVREALEGTAATPVR
jgi:DNA-binding response OmpR family regulator